MRSESVYRRSVDIMARQLELCRVAPGRPAMVLSDDATDPALLDAAVHALDEIGTLPTSVFVDELPYEGLSADPTTPDIVVNLLNGYSDEVDSLVPSNARVLSVVAQSTGELRGIVPHVGLSRRVKRGMDLLDAGQELHVGDDQGTNLRIGLRGARRWMHDGLATVPGTVAQWPRGMIGSSTAEGTAKGTVVISPGDIWLPMGWYARSSVALTFEGGRMVRIEGPQSETDAIRAHLASVGSPSAYRLDAVEIGLLWVDSSRPPALFEPGFADSFGVTDRYGHVVIATGDYPTVGVACCLRNATVAVDEVAAVRSGQPQGDLAPDVYEQAAHRFPL
ncbi:MAG: hypothetical protein F4015_11520 [Acidimicrobiia bacterium]|nr:hypothetical protein [Acidimicrobiia bacterium]MYL10069.1 hypothetical protein [Acidimicrobiia bacterium]